MRQGFKIMFDLLVVNDAQTIDDDDDDNNDETIEQPLTFDFHVFSIRFFLLHFEY